MKVAVDTPARSETCGLLSGQIARRRDHNVEGCRRLYFSLLKQALIDYEMVMDLKQGLPVSDPGVLDLDPSEVESWIFDESLDGPTSLQALCDNIDIEASWARRKIGEWREKRERGGTERLVPPQHYRGEADAA